MAHCNSSFRNNRRVLESQCPYFDHAITPLSRLQRFGDNDVTVGAIQCFKGARKTIRSDVMGANPKTVMMPKIQIWVSLDGDIPRDETVVRLPVCVGKFNARMLARSIDSALS